MGKLAAFTNRLLGFGEPMLHDHPKLGPVGFCYQLGEVGKLVGKGVLFQCLH